MLPSAKDSRWPLLMGALPFCLDGSSVAPYLYMPQRLLSDAGVECATVSESASSVKSSGVHLL